MYEDDDPVTAEQRTIPRTSLHFEVIFEYICNA